MSRAALSLPEHYEALAPKALEAENDSYSEVTVGGIAVSLVRGASKMGKKAILVDCSPTRVASRAIKAQVKTGLMMC